MKMGMDSYEAMNCDPSGEGCNNCPRYMDDCDGNEEQWIKEELKDSMVKFGFVKTEVENFETIDEENLDMLSLFLTKLNGLNSDRKIFSDCKDGSAQQTASNYAEFKKILED